MRILNTEKPSIRKVSKYPCVSRAHITRERQSECIPLSTRKNNRRPPSWRTHSITTRVGPGGGAHLLQLDRAIRPARLLGSDPGT